MTLGFGGVGMILGKSSGDEGRDDASTAAAGVSQSVAHEVDAATLPCRLEYPGDSGLDAFVSVGDHKLDPGQATTLELAQEVEPESLGFRDANVHAQDLTPAVTIDCHGDGHGNRDDAAVLADLEGGGVDPEVGSVAFHRTLQEGRDPLVDLRT